MIKRLFSLFTESAQSFEGIEPGETVMLVVRRHYFTIMTPLSFVFLFALIPLIIKAVFATELEADSLKNLFWFLSLLYYVGLWLFSFYIITLYLLNTIIVTDKRIVENEQSGFFSRKVSELHSYRIQDVSVRTHGLIETLLSFGEISVQTAAAEREFVFTKIPHPERVKNVIMQNVISHRTSLKLN